MDGESALSDVAVTVGAGDTAPSPGVVSSVPVPRRPGPPKGSPKVPGSGRKPGSPNRVTRDLRALVLTRGNPIKFLTDVVAGRRIRVGPAELYRPKFGERMKAAEILCGKIMPDLKSSELTGKDGAPLMAAEPERHDRAEIVAALASLFHAAKNAPA